MTEEVSAAANPLDQKATWSLVSGLIAVFGLFPVIQLPAAVAGLVFGIPALRSSKKGLAITGVVLSVLALIVITWLVVSLLIAARHMGFEELFRQMMTG